MDKDLNQLNTRNFNMAKKAEYKVVVGKNGFKSLEEEVMILLNKGWKPLGGIAFNSNFPHQAMARVVEDKQPQKPQPQVEKKPIKKEPMNTADAMRMLEGGI